LRLFQNIGLYSAYVPRIKKIWGDSTDFAEMINSVVEDRFGGVHYLKPVIDGSCPTFFVAGDNQQLQKQWAVENGLPSAATLEDILITQIEHHRTEIFYNMDPVRFGNDFLKRLPGCVKKSIAWRAAPSSHSEFLHHDLIVNNYPSLADHYRKQGAKTAYFFPSHDPAMDQFSSNEIRPIDILFIGGYSRHHLERASALEAVSRMSNDYNVVYNLDVSRATRLSETPLGWIGPLRKLRRPRSIQAITQRPVFGLDMYSQIAQAKVVINGKVDIAGPDRGNMRVWETLGCGATLITDIGRYPSGMRPGTDFVTYNDNEDLAQCIHKLLNGDAERRKIGKSGNDMISTTFSKDAQWRAFEDLCA
jgi:Glycosyl transferases group 1